MAGPDSAFLQELFAVFGPISVRRMFSGAGLFRDGLMFGLVVRDVIYLKVDATNEPAFEREGAAPFNYTRKGGVQAVMSYRRLPERLYDDPDELAAWARDALAAAQRQVKPKRVKASQAKASQAKASRGRNKATVTPRDAAGRGRRAGRSRR